MYILINFENLNLNSINVVCLDMPAGVVSLTMHTDQQCVTLTPVTYYTSMGEISRHLQNATDPVNFICQVSHFVVNTNWLPHEVHSVVLMLVNGGQCGKTSM